MPNSDTAQRKLAAIMFTDMVGYRALTQRSQVVSVLCFSERALVKEHSV